MIQNLPKKAFNHAAMALSMLRLVWQAHHAFFIGLLVIEIVQGIVPLAYAWLMKTFLDLLVVVSNMGTLAYIPYELIIFLLIQATLSAISSIVAPLSNFMSADLGRRLSLNTQLLICQKVNELMGIGPFEDPRFYDLVQIGSQGAYSSPIQAIHILMSILRNLVTIFGFVLVLIAFSPLLALVVALAVLPQMYVQAKLSRQDFNLQVENSPKSRLAGYYNSILMGAGFAKEVRLFGLANYFTQPFLCLMKEIHRSQRHQQMREMSWRVILDTFTNLVGTTTFIVVIIQAFSGRLTVGDVTLYISAVGNLQGALLSIIFSLVNLNESILYYERFTNLLALPQPIAIAETAIPVAPLRSEIEFRNVSFRYSDQHPWVLRRVNLTIPAQRCVALVGLNGTGKTTLVKLLTRLYDPTEGQILWDGIDIRAFDPTELRRRIGAIFQDFIRYDLTAYENIGVGDITNMEDSARIHQAALQAGIHATIEALPQGYQTRLSRRLACEEPGADLSGGQWQKVALARMFMREADMLILDEPTAALDAQSEYELYRHFAELVEGRTSLLISHRFSTVRIADFIAVIEDGQVTEYGSHSELMEKSRSYAKLYNMQAEQYRSQEPLSEQLF